MIISEFTHLFNTIKIIASYFILNPCISEMILKTGPITTQQNTDLV